MTSGWFMLAAFLGGLAIALTLEARLLSRSRSRRGLPRLYRGLALLSLICAGALGWAARQTGPAKPDSAVQTEGIASLQDLRTLSPPLSSEGPLSRPGDQSGVVRNRLERVNPALIEEHSSPTTSTPPEPLTRVLQDPSITAVPEPPSHQPTRLQIPAFQVDAAIQMVPLRDGRWDVSELGGQVGLLATTGQSPADDLAMVFAGHMTFPDDNLLETGAFADLQYATYGTEIVVQTASEKLVYEVAEISRIPPDAVDHLYLPDNNSILLITCTDWAEEDGIYANRLLIRAQAVPDRG